MLLYRSTLLCALAIFLILIPTPACTPDDPDREEWIDLFNGRDLQGWDIKISGYGLNENFGETFRVEDGLLKVRYDNYEMFEDRFGHIFYEEPYSHYRLRVEYRFVGEQVDGGPGWAFRNNGIMFHSQAAADLEVDQDFPDSIEFQLLGGDGENERSNGNVCTPGTRVVIDGELQTIHCISSDGPTHHGDQWVTAELFVHADSVARHYLNGEPVMEYYDLQLNNGTPLTGGYIALQAESHPIDFRSIRLLNLSGCGDPDARNYKSYITDHRPESCIYR